MGLYRACMSLMIVRGERGVMTRIRLMPGAELSSLDTKLTKPVHADSPVPGHVSHP